MATYTSPTTTSRPRAGLLAARQIAGGPLSTVVVLLGLWGLAVLLFNLPAYLLPSPWAVISQWWANLPALLPHALATASVILLGYGCAVLLAIPLALAIAFFPFAARTVYPGIVMLQNVPKIAIAPLFVIWFGFGLAPKVLLVFLITFFPIMVSAASGFRALPREILDFVRSTGAGSWTIFRLVRLPAALPQVFVGLRIAATVAPTAAIVAEFVASDQGLGYLLLRYNGDLNTTMSFAAILTLGMIGVSLFSAIEFAERLMTRRRGATMKSDASN